MTAPSSPAPSVVIVVQARVAPGQGPQARALINEFVEPTRRENGCIRYTLHLDLEDDDNIVLLEEWRDEASLAAHMATDGYAALMGGLAPLMVGTGSGLRLQPLP